MLVPETVQQFASSSFVSYQNVPCHAARVTFREELTSPISLFIIDFAS